MANASLEVQREHGRKVDPDLQLPIAGCHQAAGRRNFQKHGLAICPTCAGSGQVVSQDWRGRSRKGGNESYRRSLEPGAMSMAQRGRRGGRPRALRLEDLK